MVHDFVLVRKGDGRGGVLSTPAFNFRGLCHN
jgi:hypothetical protein